MPKYAIHDAEGTILRTMDIAAEHITAQLNDGEQFVEADAGPYDRINVQTGEVIAGEPPIAVRIEPPLYARQRKALYPHLAVQLDMLWHAMDKGEIPKATTFYESIKAVKQAVPVEGLSVPTLVYDNEPVPGD